MVWETGWHEDELVWKTGWCERGDAAQGTRWCGRLDGVGDKMLWRGRDDV